MSELETTSVETKIIRTRTASRNFANLSIIPPSPLPPAPAWSAKSASTLIRVRCCQTTPAKCALRRPNPRHRWQSPPAPATAECSHRSMPAAPVPHYSTAHRRHESHAEYVSLPPTLLRDGSRSAPLRNSLPNAASALQTASPPRASHFPLRDSVPTAGPAPVAPSPPLRSRGY